MSKFLPEGVYVRDIQAWLGHADLSTTMIYLGVTESRTMGALEKL